MILRISATKRSGDLAILEQDQGGNGPHVVGAGRARVLVDIELLDAHLAVELFGDLFQGRRDLPAWAAPLRPKVDDYRGWRFEHLGLEGVVGNLFSCHSALLIAGGARETTRLFER